MNIVKIKTTLEDIKRIISKSDLVDNFHIISLVDQVTELTNIVEKIDTRLNALEYLGRQEAL
jgi:pyruvate carboxylase